MKENHFNEKMKNKIQINKTWQPTYSCLHPWSVQYLVSIQVLVQAAKEEVAFTE